jgi:cell division protein ZapB
MENQLRALETKLALLIEVSTRLRAENHQLRQDIAQAQSANRQLSDKMDVAKARLEKLLTTLPDETV